MKIWSIPTRRTGKNTAKKKKTMEMMEDLKNPRFSIINISESIDNQMMRLLLRLIITIKMISGTIRKDPPT